MLKRDQLLRPDQVAGRLNVSRRTAYRLIAEGHFKVVPVRGSLRIYESSIDDYLERQLYLYELENGVLEKTVPIVP